MDNKQKLDGLSMEDLEVRLWRAHWELYYRHRGGKRVADADVKLFNESCELVENALNLLRKIDK